MDRCHIPARIRRVVWARQDGRCAVCETDLCAADVAVDFDHIVPRACWPRGRDAVGNIQALCAACHALKTRASGEREAIATIAALVASGCSLRVCWLCRVVFSAYWGTESVVCARCTPMLQSLAAADATPPPTAARSRAALLADRAAWRRVLRPLKAEVRRRRRLPPQREQICSATAMGPSRRRRPVRPR